MSIWFPFLPTDLYKRKMRRSTGKPCDSDLVLLIETVKQQQVVAHACPNALGAGVRPGMVVSVARAAGSTYLAVVPFDAHGTRRALRAAAQWCHRYSPVVAIEDADGLCLNVTGCTHLFGGEHRMISQMESAFGRLGLMARIAIAPTFASARAVVRGNGSGVLVEAGGIREAVNGLPASVLGLDATTLESLAEVNIRHIGELLTLPRAAIAARFGDGLLKITDRLLGRTPEVIQPLRPVEPVRVEKQFEGPCSNGEAIGLACRDLLKQLERKLEVCGAGTVEWCVTLIRSDLDPLLMTLQHCAPNRCAKHLWRLLQPRLERAHLGFGVEGVVITALRTKRIGHHQRRWWGGQEEKVEAPSCAVLIDTLTNRLGPDAVMRAELVASHVPEKAFVFRSMVVAHASAPDVEPVESDRPTRLFPMPVPVRVIALSPDGPVSHVEWQGTRHTIITCIGPERVSGEWWQQERLRRDYFKLQDEHGQWLWLYRDHLQNRWFLSGVWA